VRDEPRSRREREQAWPELQVHFGKQVQRDDGRPCEVGAKEVLLAELDPRRDAGGTRIGAALLDELGDDLDAEPGRAAPRR